MILYLKDNTESEKSLLCKHICKNNVKWKKAMILYLKDDTEFEKSLFYKYVCKNDVMN